MLQIQEALNVSFRKISEKAFSASDAFSKSTTILAGSVAEGSNLARLFNDKVVTLTVEIDFMTVWMDLPDDVTENYIFATDHLDVDTGDVRLVWKEFLKRYVDRLRHDENSFQKLDDLKAAGVVREGEEIEPAKLLKLFRTPMSQEALNKIRHIMQTVSPEVM